MQFNSVKSTRPSSVDQPTLTERDSSADHDSAEVQASSKAMTLKFVRCTSTPCPKTPVLRFRDESPTFEFEFEACELFASQRTMRIQR